MKARFAATENLVDASSAAIELAMQIKTSMEFNNNSCGIVFYDYDIDAVTLIEALHGELGIDIYGCSCEATLSSDGYSEMNALLIVLTSDNCSFAGSAVHELNKDNFESDVKKMYLEANSKLSDKPKLIITFGNMVNDVSIDDFMGIISELSHNCPMFGYMAADDSSLTKVTIAAGKKLLGNKAFSILMIDGDIMPEFVLKSVPIKATYNTSTITKSSVNTVYEIGGKPPLDFLKQTGLLKFCDTVSAEELIQLLFGYPFLLEPVKGINKDNVPVVRVIANIDTDRQMFTFFGTVPEGSEVSVCYITEADIVKTFEEAIIEADQIARKKNAGCILAVSCIARSYMLIGNSDAEGRAITEYLKCNVPLVGCYGFGEIVPTSINQNGANNAHHNCTVGLCIL